MRILAVAVLALVPLTSWAAAQDRPLREHIEWCDIWVTAAEQSDTPKVLLVGDSITRGYFDSVAQQLQGKADCARLATSKCVADPAFLDELKLLVGQYPFAVIHFNNGLHGYGYTEQQYRDGLLKAIELIHSQSPQATLILANTTPVRQRQDLQQLADETQQVVQPRNRIAAEIAQARKIPVDDLYTLGVEHPEFYGGDGVHYNDQGRTAQGHQVAALIAPYLPGTAAAKPAE
jgi:hypothetical protein